jgi:bifunctional UDP-N-acetylglucosamine pyrophosphorylase/glucosamine-1-phosphate N-acetyltransferase
MQTVLLAAGDGLRMEPLSSSVPKPLLPVGGDALLVHAARRAVAAGASDLVVVVPPYYQPFARTLGNTVNDVPVRYAVQPRPTGTANALVGARRHLDDDFVVLPGDCVFDVSDLESLYETVPTICVRATTGRNTDPVVVGDGGPVDVARLADDHGTAYVDAGACSLPREAMQWTRFPPNDAGERDLATVVDRTAATDDVRPVVVDDHVDVDSPGDLLAANRRVFEDVSTGGSEESATGGFEVADGTVEEMARCHGPVRVSEGASVANGAVVEGPAVVDANAVVESNAYVGPYSYVGPNVTVEHSTRVANTILLEDARIGPNCAVEDSVLGRDADVGARTIVANHDPGPEHEPTTTERESGASTCLDDRSVQDSTHSFGMVVGASATVSGTVHVDSGVVVPQYATVDDDSALRCDDSP